jgi:hypothetical protein
MYDNTLKNLSLFSIISNDSFPPVRIMRCSRKGVNNKWHVNPVHAREALRPAKNGPSQRITSANPTTSDHNITASQNLIARKTSNVMLNPSLWELNSPIAQLTTYLGPKLCN